MPIVRAGDLWEAEERVFYILKIVRSSFLKPNNDEYEYLELTREQSSLFDRGHLTIRGAEANGYPGLWKKIA